jgi:hypothetical protein
VVRSVRRRRTVPPNPEPTPPAKARSWLIYAALATGLAALMFDGFLTDRPSKPPLPGVSQATKVRSAIAESSESLQVVVGWDLSLSDAAGAPESVRVRVIPEQADTVVLVQPANQLADTAYLPVPPAGQAIKRLLLRGRTARGPAPGGGVRALAVRQAPDRAAALGPEPTGTGPGWREPWIRVPGPHPPASAR